VKRSKDASRPTPTERADDAKEKIRDAVKVAIRGMLHRNEELNSFDALAKINGYERVRIDGDLRRVQLAEGIIADAHKRVNDEITVFARPARRRGREQSVIKNDHPPFLEEDFTIYRIMERRVDEWFNEMENGVREWCRSKVDRAKKAVDRAYAPVSKLISSSRNGSASDADVNSDTDLQVGAKEDQVTSLTTAADDYEDVLLLSKRDGRTILVEDVPRQYRLLVLPENSSFRPYDLRHGRSGTVIYTGIVLFGAVPLTYRSLNYAMDYAEYPVITNTIIASAVASVSYSVWASRYSARTRQSLAVSSATSSRIVARDDAVEVLLADEACGALANAAMNEYLSRLDQKGGRDGGRRASWAKTPPSAGVDPVSIALELGLLRRKDAVDRDLVAVNLATLSSDITSRFMTQRIEKLASSKVGDAAG